MLTPKETVALGARLDMEGISSPHSLSNSNPDLAKQVAEALDQITRKLTLGQQNDPDNSQTNTRRPR